jgi:hypothetical protein
MLANDGPTAAKNDDTDSIHFESDLSTKDWAQKFTAGEVPRSPLFLPPIVTLSPTNTIGLGRTNLTLIAPTIVQTDASPAYASFAEVQTSSGGPAVSVHFTPSGYGITNTASYVFSFQIATNGGPTTFAINGYAGGGTIVGAGTKSLNGTVTTTLILNGVPADQTVYADIQQTSGNPWSWYSTLISHPPIFSLPQGPVIGETE